MATKPAQQTPLSAAFKECRFGFVLLGVVSCFINILILTSPIYMIQTFDRVLSSGRTETLIYLTLIAGIAVLFMGLLEMVRGRLLQRISRWLGRRLGPDLIASSMNGTRYGLNQGAQPLRDLQVLRGFVGSPSINALFDAPWAPLFIVVIWLLHPWLGILALVAAVVLLLVAFANEWMSRKALKKAGHMSIVSTQNADSAVRNAEVFHAMGMLPGFLRSWSERETQALNLHQSAGDMNATLVGFSKFMRLFVQILILALGAYLVLKGELTSGGMIAGSILLGRALAPVEQSIGAWKAFVNARDAYGRLRSLLEKLPPATDTMPLPAPRGDLACEQVIYVPQGRENPVLNGVNFELSHGEALGIIGPSAAGKSTLCRIIVGMWRPTRGRARLDGADLFAWPADQLGPYLGYLPQDVELFAGSVRENIARLDQEAEPARVVEAAMAAGVHDMILHLPNGYETEIGEGGAYLSGGQRQRIGLARALYGQPRLIVLDEPNANLDNDGEEALVGAIQQAKGWGAAVVIVAHQPRILRPVDKLLLLREGRMELFGPRDEVLAKLRPKPVADQRQANQQQSGQQQSKQQHGAGASVKGTAKSAKAAAGAAAPNVAAAAGASVTLKTEEAR